MDGRPRQRAKHKKVEGTRIVLRCPIDDCIYEAPFVSLMEIHLRKHSSEKAFPCDQPACDHACSQKANLKKHFRNVHAGCDEDGNLRSKKEIAALFKAYDPKPIETPLAYDLAETCSDEAYLKFELRQDDLTPESRKEKEEALAKTLVDQKEALFMVLAHGAWAIIEEEARLEALAKEAGRIFKPPKNLRVLTRSYKSPPPDPNSKRYRPRKRFKRR